MVIVSKGNYPNIVNPLSPIMQLERLVTKPFGFIILYAVSIIMSTACLTYNVILLVTKKNKVKAQA